MKKYSVNGVCFYCNDEYLSHNKVCEILNYYESMLNQLSDENEELNHLKVLANAFIVEKGLEVEFVKWCVE